MNTARIPFLFPPFHETLDFWFWGLRIGIKICHARILQFRSNITNDRDPMLTGSRTDVRIEHNTQLSIPLFCERTNVHGTQCAN